MSDFKKGDHVEFTIHKRPNYGTIVDKVTEDTELRGFTVHASKKDPQYIIQHDRTGTEFNRHGNKMKHADDSKSTTTAASEDQDQG